jgi:hypothetical protein
LEPHRKPICINYLFSTPSQKQGQVPLLER